MRAEILSDIEYLEETGRADQAALAREAMETFDVHRSMVLGCGDADREADPEGDPHGEPDNRA